MLCLGLSPLLASERFNVEEGLPTALEDAFPIAEPVRQLQGIARYTRTDNHQHLLALEPALEWHFTPRWPISLSVPFVYEEGSGVEHRDVEIELFHNLNAESTYTNSKFCSSKEDVGKVFS